MSAGLSGITGLGHFTRFKALSGLYANDARGG